MIPAARTTTTPAARSLSGRGSDGVQRDDGFGTALAGVEQNTATDAAVTKGAAGALSALATMKPGAEQGIAALLAKLASGVTSATADGQGSGAKTNVAGGLGDAPGTVKSEKSSDDTASDGAVAANPLAGMAALLPGVVATPAPTVAAAAQAASDSARLSLSLGDGSIAKAVDGSRGQAGATSAEDAGTESGVGFALVASSSHLAPLQPAPPPAMPHADGATLSDGPKSDTALTGDATGPSVSAATETSSHDASPTAVGMHAEPGAGLPDGTLLSIAGAVTSLAANPAAASSEVASSTAAAVTDPTPALIAPARSLTLQLTPGDLGTVTVHLHLTAGGLDVRLAVDDRKTLASISHARDELAAAIGDNGYRVESLVIRGADASSTSTAGSNDSAKSQSEAGAGQSFSGSGSGGSGDDTSSSRQRTPQSSSPRDSGGDRGSGGVFV